MARKLTLICAPAGFGKTTLLSEWRSSDPWNRLPVAWLSLDEGDNDPVRFWGYSIAALDKLQAGVGETPLALLHSLPSQPIETVLTALINALTEISEDFAFVLDDYHVIEAEPIHRSVAFLLDHMPPHMHIAITSRTVPALPLARLRVRDQLTELRAADLRLSGHEATTFLNQVMGLNLAAEEVIALEERTEGWFAGLQLAALSIQGEEDRRSLPDFTGSHRYVLDYFADEVFHRQHESVRNFLLQTSILHRHTGSLCDAVTGNHVGQAMLETLEKANLLTIPLDNERRWYRYHPLFADFLRSQLRKTYPDGELERELHRRAARWYTQNGLLPEAIEHSLAARDFEQVGCLVEETAPRMLMRGEVGTLLSWLKVVPDALKRSRPRLGLFDAWAKVVTVQLDNVEPCLRDIEAVLRETVPDRGGEAERSGMLGEVAAIRATAASFERDVSATIELSLQALQTLPKGNLFARGMSAQNLGLAYRMRGDESGAIKALVEAAGIGRAANNILLALMATTFLADAYQRRGQLHRAADRYGQALQLAGSQTRRPLPVAGFAYVGLARVQHKWNDLEAATGNLERAISLGKQWAGVEILADGYISLANLRKTQRDFDGAVALLEQAEEIVRRHDLTHRHAMLTAVRARLCLAVGDIDGAGYWSEECLTSTSNGGCLTEPAHIVQARVLMAKRKHAEAIALLDRLLPTAEEAGRTGSVIEILALTALSLEAVADIDPATASLERALSLAEPEGYMRTFVDEGPAMVALLSKVGEAHLRNRAQRPSNALLAYLNKLLKALDIDVATPSQDNLLESEALPEPLSRRELEVLQMIADGLRNNEIATRLVVATSTIKSHTNNIFAKLSVSHRTQAVARARELRLIQTG